MKKNLLLIDADGDSVAVVMEAAAANGQAVRLATKTADAFKILHAELEELDVVVLDADPDAHAMALLEAMTGYEQAPPVIILTALEEEYMKHVAARHGASACVGKPLTVEKLKSTLARLAHLTPKRACSCDAWGHVCEEQTARPSCSCSPVADRSQRNARHSLANA